jgi:hypothetical protein
LAAGGCTRVADGPRSGRAFVGGRLRRVAELPNVNRGELLSAGGCAASPNCRTSIGESFCRRAAAPRRRTAERQSGRAFVGGRLRRVADKTRFALRATCGQAAAG